jgi:hypothetical protein
MSLRALVVAVLLVLVTSPAWSQETTGSLQGRTVTGAGDPLAGVRVTITSPSLQGARTVETSPQGFFRIPSIPVGRYTVQFARIGHRPVVVESVLIELGKTTPLERVTLEATPIELEPVYVTAAPVVIDVTSTTVGANLDAATIELLPTERNYRDISTFLPHANESFYGDEVNMGGGSGSDNAYFVDGVNITDPYRGKRGTNLPYNFIKEIQVRQGGYEAEFGRATGGVINVITHSGSNRWEVSGFGYFTNDALTAEKQSGLLDFPERNSSSYDIGLRVSGPVVRDRLWVSAAYNPTFEKRDVQALNQGFFEERRTEHRFATKVTWRATQGLDLVASVFGDPTTHNRVGPAYELWAVSELANPDPYLRVTDEGGVAFSLLARGVLGRRVVLEGSAAHSRGDDGMHGATDIGRTEPYFINEVTNVGEGGVGERVDIEGRRTSVNVSSLFFLGAHTVKVGGGYEVARIDQSNLGDAMWQYGDSSFQTYTYDNALSGIENRLPTVYAQDSWRATKRLTLNFGLRWDGQYLVGAGDTVAQDFTKQWQPRLGVTFQPGALGSQKVFGSFGRFYLQHPLYPVLIFFSDYCDAISLFSTDPREPGSEPEVRWEWCALEEKVEDVDGEQFDELTLGYERIVAGNVRLAVQGIHRVLRAAWGSGLDSDLNWVPGNPGQGELTFLPEAKRQYTALEITAERRAASGLSFLATYVLSRSHGNYTGMFTSDLGLAQPGLNFALACEEQGPNSEGLLPNNRTHVFKLASSYRFDFGFSAGTYLTWQSGAPLNEFGPSDCLGIFRPVFLVPRGSAGSLPSIWDLNLRLTYTISPRLGLPLWGRVVLDILHIGNPTQMVFVDQYRYVGLDSGSQVPNSTFGEGFAYQPPMTVRLGLELGY